MVSGKAWRRWGPVCFKTPAANGRSPEGVLLAAPARDLYYWTSGSDMGQVFQVFRLPEGYQTSPHLQSCYGCTLRTTEVRPCFSAPLPLTAAHASRNLTQDTQRFGWQ